jgi:hypothetical protein
VVVLDCQLAFATLSLRYDVPRPNRGRPRARPQYFDCPVLPHSGSSPAVRYLNKGNTILANILLVSNNVAAEFLVESASAFIFSKDPQARRLQPPAMQVSTHCAHQGVGRKNTPGDRHVAEMQCDGTMEPSTT